MSERPESHQSDSEKLPVAIPFSSSFPSTNGPETIVNLERRGKSSSGGAVSSSRPDSSIWHRLFPIEPLADTKSAVGPAGFQLDHFVIEERIGSGGMGAVFRAADQRLQRLVALKVLAPAQSRDVNAVQRFQNEARAAAKLDHDNIARVHYVGEDQGIHFIAFEYVTGSNVRDLIHQSGRLDPADAVNYTLQIATALKHTSTAGVVHRDIKPSNIIVTPSGRAKLVDLGLARKQSSDSVGELTMAGTTLGTFDYISPEQAKDPRNVDVRSDIYSLGCTLYHMLTGEPPYPEGTVLQKLLDHQGKDPPSPSKKNRRVPENLSAIVQKMMASDPKHRYATPDDLSRDLLLAAGHMGLRGVNPEGLVWSSPASQKVRFWERNLGWLATAAALLVIVFLLEQFPQIGKETERLGFGEPSLIAGVDQDQGTETGADSSNPSTNGDRPGAGTSTPKTTLGGNKPAVSPTNPVGSGTATGNKTTSSDPGKPGSIPKEPTIPGSEPSGGTPNTAETNNGSGLHRPSGNDDREPVVAIKPKINGESVAGASGQNAPNVLTMSPTDKAAISIVSSDGGKPQIFPTLEAACSAAEDGDIIELRYNGKRKESEKPVRIVNKKITIRAAKGFRPLIDFKSQEIPAEGFETRMISVTKGSVELINLDLRILVHDDVPTDQWALFSLHGTDRIRMQGVNITFVNPNSGSHPATVVELVAGSNQGLAKMKMTGNGQPGITDEFEIEVVASLIRGGCDLFVAKHAQPGRFDLEQSLIAIDGTLLTVLGDNEMIDDDAYDLELQMKHNTCLLGAGLLKMDSGGLPRFLPPVQVTAHDNIIATNTSTPLVGMYGNTNLDDFRQLLRWEGTRNFYDQFEVFWIIRPMQVTAEAISIDFDGWKRFLGSETGMTSTSQGVVWKDPRLTKELSEITAEDLQLDRSVPRDSNPAAGGASDGSDAGVNPTRLPKMRDPDDIDVD